MKKIVKTLIALTLTALVLLCCACANDSVVEENPNFDLKIDILKIGKADCIVINTGTKIIMIDTGETENVNTINNYMQKKGYNRIDTLILTHYDKDHIGGASKIIAAYEVGEVIESTFVSNTSEYINYHNVLSSKGMEANKLIEDYSAVSDDCAFKIYTPKKNKYKENSDNNFSLVVELKYKNRSFLFCGDAMELRLSELIKDGIGNYDFVKLPYHGNYISNYEEFLNEVNPKYGAITNSNKNPGSEAVISMLTNREVSVFQTKNGEINVVSNGEKIEIYQ